MYQRQFRSPIFFGCEDCVEQVKTLKEILDRAISLQSGLQQPDHSPDEETAKKAALHRKLGEREVDLIRQDIWVALGGVPGVWCTQSGSPWSGTKEGA